MSPITLSFAIATVATIVAGVVGIAVATLLAVRRFAGRNLLDVFLTLPMVLPPTVLGYYLLVSIGRRSAIGRAFEALTGHSIVFSKTGAIVAAALGALPIVIKAARAALEDVDPRLVMAARTLGATPLRAYFTVHLPLARSGITAALMLAFARALGDFGVTLMVAGIIPGETQTAPLAIYDAIEAGRERDAVSLVAILTVTAAVVMYVVTRTTRAGRSNHVA